jgi:DNA-binding GntR family transcriptional regulator
MIDGEIGAKDGPGRRGGTSARAADAIRDLILTRAILPGEQVRQEDLAVEIGTSRGPIREALQILAVEGLVRHEPNRGYFVSRLTMQDMKQIYLVRDLLESEVLRSLGTPSENVIAELREINDKIRALDATSHAVADLNTRFHALMMAESPLTYLKEVLTDVQRKYIAYQTVLLHDREVWQAVAEQHEEMVDALEAGDADRLVELARHHREVSLIRLAPVLG